MGWLLLILYIALTLKALAIRKDLQRHTASVAIIQVVLNQVQDLVKDGSWSILEKKNLNLGSSPSLYIWLVHECTKANIRFTVNKHYSLCEVDDFAEKNEAGFFIFNVSRPAHYFDINFLAKALKYHERWKESEPSNFERFLYPPTGGLCTLEPKDDIYGSSDAHYKGKMRMAKKNSSVRYPVLDY